MTPTRRAVLAGAVALAAPLRAAEDEAGAALDAARQLPPVEALVRLACVRATTLARSLDLEAARAGLAVDVALARFPPLATQRQLLTAARDAGRPGAVTLPDGAAWYALQLRRQLGDGVDPIMAERRLRAELDRLHRRAASLFAQIGIDRGSIGERYRRVWADERFLYADSAAGREEAVVDMRAALDRVRPHVAALVGPVPPACLAVTVRALSPAEAAAGRGGYRELPTPGVPGGYVVDLRTIRRRPRWTLPSVVAHELLPGHLVQLPIEAATPPHPLRADYAAAFVEGWGAHAETLAATIGAYDTPRAMLGHLHWLIFRIARALVDLGIHRHGWPPATARARLAEWQGEPAYFAPFDDDLARIAVEPATRLAEALAWLALSDRAARLDDARRRRFHRAVLAGGRKRLEQVVRC